VGRRNGRPTSGAEQPLARACCQAYPAAASTAVIPPVEDSCTRVPGSLAISTKITAMPNRATHVSHGNPHIRTTSFSGASRFSRARNRSCETAMKIQTARITAPIMLSSQGEGVVRAARPVREMGKNAHSVGSLSAQRERLPIVRTCE
jgi:hypothetical protein